MNTPPLVTELDSDENAHPDDRLDVVIVGAGLSGLAAARSLVARGLSVRVLEATDRLGGRLKSQNVNGVHVDLGGTFVGPTQDRLRALADEVGVRRYPTFDGGQNVIQWKGALKTYRGTTPPLSPAALLDVARVQSSMERLAKTVPLGRPAEAPRASEFDLLSLEAWLSSQHASSSTRALFAIVAKVTWGCEPAEISFLQALNYVNMAGGLHSLLDTKGGAQEEHFVEGSHEIVQRVAAELGDVITMNSPATTIQWDESGVTVHTAATTFRARRVIIAVPPALRRRITFDPVLPHSYDHLAQRWPQGVLSKAYAIYERPFWRDKGLSGQGLSDQGPVFITFDASPEDDSAGVLLGFIGGDYARHWDDLDEPERRIRVLSAFAEMYGPEALRPVSYIDQRWATESWVGGGPTAVPAPGVVAHYSRYLAEPVGPLHWAGTETSDRWNGYMDGAIRAGERAAREVTSVLSRTTRTTLTERTEA